VLPLPQSVSTFAASFHTSSDDACPFLKPMFLFAMFSHRAPKRFPSSSPLHMLRRIISSFLRRKFKRKKSYPPQTWPEVVASSPPVSHFGVRPHCPPSPFLCSGPERPFLTLTPSLKAIDLLLLVLLLSFDLSLSCPRLSQGFLVSHDSQWYPFLVKSPAHPATHFFIMVFTFRFLLPDCFIFATTLAIRFGKAHFLTVFPLIGTLLLAAQKTHLLRISA